MIIKPTRRKLLLGAGAVLAGVSPASSYWQSRLQVSAGGGASFTTFDPAHIEGTGALSGGNLVFDSPSGGGTSTRSISSPTSGLHYCEMSASSLTGNMQIGLCSPSHTGTISLTSNTESIGWQASNAVFINSVQVATFDAWAVGDTLALCVDATNKTFWGRVNAGNWNASGTANPSTNTGGVDISVFSAGGFMAACLVFFAGADITANFGATAYSQTVPSGASNF